MIWCFLALFAAFSCRLLLLAAVFWDVLQIAPFATSVAPKWYQNALQRPQNTSKIDPKSTQNCPLEHPGPTKWNQNPIFSFWDRFWSPIWCPLGPKIDQKIDILREKCSKKPAYKAMFAWRVASPHFLYLFWSFLVKKRRKKHHVVALLAGVSHPWKTMYFTGYPAWGQCFDKYAEILEI